VLTGRYTHYRPFKLNIKYRFIQSIKNQTIKCTKNFYVLIYVAKESSDFSEISNRYLPPVALNTDCKKWKNDLLWGIYCLEQCYHEVKYF